MDKCAFFILFFLAPCLAFPADYTYQNQNGQLTVTYSTTDDGKTIQTLHINGELITQHCYKDDKRLKNDTSAECNITGGGNGGSTGGGSTGGSTLDPINNDKIIITFEANKRVRFEWQNLPNTFIGIVPAGQSAWAEGMSGAETDGSASGKTGITVNEATPGQIFQAIFTLNGEQVAISDPFTVIASDGSIGSVIDPGTGTGGGGTDGGGSGGSGGTGGSGAGGGTTGGGTDGGTDSGSGVEFPAAVTYSSDWNWAFPYNSSEPAMGSYTTDPKTGYKVWRLGGSQSEMNSAKNHPLSLANISAQNAQHYYSRVEPTNSDESYVLSAGGHKGGYAALWRLADKQLVQWVPVGGDGSQNIPHPGTAMLLWDKNFNNVYWYADGNRLMRATIDINNGYQVSTENIVTFGTYDYITLTGGEGDFSDDGSRLILIGSYQDTAASDYILFYDVANKQLRHTRERTKNHNTQLDWASVDPTGKWVVFDESLPLGNVTATVDESWTWVIPFDNPTATPRLLYPNKKHSDFVVDDRGESWIVYGNWLGVFASSLERSYLKRVWPMADYEESPVLEIRDQAGNEHTNYYADDEGYFHNHQDGEDPKVHLLDQTANGHISRVAAVPGRVLVAREADKALYFLDINVDVTQPPQPGATRFLGVTHNSNRPVQEGGSYKGEARGSASKSGKHIFFVTDYERGDQAYYLNMIELGGSVTTTGSGTDTGEGSGSGTTTGTDGTDTGSDSDFLLHACCCCA